MDELENLMAEWDKAATPNEFGFHDGAGFAMNNWAIIRDYMHKLIWSR